MLYAGCFYMLFERNTDNIRGFIEAHLFKNRRLDHLDLALKSERERPLQPVIVSAGANPVNKAGAV
jgi:hypothetical protein